MIFPCAGDACSLSPLVIQCCTMLVAGKLWFKMTTDKVQ